MTSPAILVCENFSIGYGDNIVIEGLNFSINKGDFLVIVGENGSGKSTLVKSILGLVEPISGRAYLDIKHNKTGYLSQQSEVQKDFPATVYEVVLSGFANRLGFRPFYNAQEKKTALDNIKKMNMENFASSHFSNLSGGQKQKVLLARMLCAGEDIVFLDEPVTALDSASEDYFYKVICDFNRKGATVIMVTHDKKCLDYASCILELGKDWKFTRKDARVEQ